MESRPPEPPAPRRGRPAHAAQQWIDVPARPRRFNSNMAQTRKALNENPGTLSSPLTARIDWPVPNTRTSDNPPKFHVSDALRSTHLHPGSGGQPVQNRFQQLTINDDDQEINPNLQEKWSRHTSTSSQQPEGTQSRITRPRLAQNPRIREYMYAKATTTDPSSWLCKCEIPTSTEINGDEEHSGGGDEVEIPVNKIDGAWASKEEYLQAHYELLREDGVSPLRDAVDEVRMEPNLMERDSRENAFIYEKVHIIGFTFASAGIAARITFSLRRAGKKIIWGQSKRLMTGSLIALTPAEDMFQSICRVALVAARPLAGVQQNPPEIDIFFGGCSEIEIDPQQEWVIVESRTGYFESYRHTLRCLQKLAGEKFPLSEHVVSLEQDIQAPDYLREQPLKDLSFPFPSDSKEFLNVDILEDWPVDPPSELDASQIGALQRILAKKVAIIQGPPGTGKTHVSVVAIRTLLQNMTAKDPPIILAAHTNHAVDQLLRHVAQFEPDFIRLGGRSTDQETIKPRTLYEVKRSSNASSNLGGLRGSGFNRMKMLIKELKAVLRPLIDCDQPLQASTLRDLKVLSEAQYDSLTKGAAEWVRADQKDKIAGVMAMWLGSDLIDADRRTLPEDFGNEVEEVDLEFEQLQELEAEGKTNEDDDYDTLRGDRVVLKEPFTGRRLPGLTDQKAIQLLQKQESMWAIPQTSRGAIYQVLQQQAKEAIRKAFCEKAQTYAEISKDVKIGNMEIDSTYLQQARIIGMTTTGLCKNRALIDSVKPRIVLIEEAAETIEAYVTAACFDTLEHLILVGDHKQLRGHCNVRELEGHPWYLDVSMFERMVQNGVEFSQMTRQRRMIPEIRRALQPIYAKLEDHPSVLERAPVPGMGGVDTFFFSHNWPESSDSYMSKICQTEAEMIVAFFDYLVHNGMLPKEITVLTFYNGQRKIILRNLRNHRNLSGCHFNVVTVDSYQGEENDIVLLSLVRSNETRNIGFLATENRVCVALSRAQRGFYIFGNAPVLCHANFLWWEIVQIMARDPRRVGFLLPLTCKNHGQRLYAANPEFFTGLCGGCDLPCQAALPCGHTCHLNCHPFSHDSVNCQARCCRTLECGHICLEACFVQPCICACTRGKGRANFKQLETQPPTSSSFLPLTKKLQNAVLADSSPRLVELDVEVRDLRELTQQGQAFRDYAEGGHVQHDAQLQAIAEDEADKERQKQIVETTAQGLFGLDVGADTKDSENTPTSPTLVRRFSNGNGGTRSVWEMVHGAGSLEAMRKKAEEVSLLD